MTKEVKKEENKSCCDAKKGCCAGILEKIKSLFSKNCCKK